MENTDTMQKKFRDSNGYFGKKSSQDLELPSQHKSRIIVPLKLVEIRS